MDQEEEQGGRTYTNHMDLTTPWTTRSRLSPAAGEQDLFVCLLKANINSPANRTGSPQGF